MAIGTYQGAELDISEVKLLKEFEELMKKPIPKCTSPDEKLDFGFLAEKNHVKILALARGNLMKLPDELGAFVEIEELNLANNRLKSLPSSIGTLGKSLLRLDLWANKLEFSSFPPSMAILYRLHFLELGLNPGLKKEARKYGDYWENSHKSRNEVSGFTSKFRKTPSES